MVVKSDGRTQPFDREKIVGGVRAAVKGRAVTDEQIQQVAIDVEDELRLAGGEVSTARIGLAVLDEMVVELRRLGKTDGAENP